jgi:glycosyltransferase involved in cell wall biosynthesis
MASAFENIHHAGENMISKTTVIVPAYNEGRYLAKTLKTVRHHTLLGQCSLIVVDDGSSDETSVIASWWTDHVVRLPENMGKGAALWQGIQATDGDYFLFMDADVGETAGGLSSLLEYVWHREIDMAIACPPSAKHGGFGMVRRFARRSIWRLTGRELAAPLSGQRALTRRAVEAVGQWNCGFGIEVAMTLDVLRAGLSICEIPLLFRHREHGKTVAGFWHRGRQYAAIQKVIATQRDNWR